MDTHMAMRNIQKKRTTNFREDETKLLIQLWGSPQIQNKLYLTHRKAPVMRLIAANMQHRGFYRTPDEIKTRIRNLKCLYHRIKRSMTTGAGIGTVDPDWPHFKAMDEILTRKNKPQNLYRDNILEGPRCEDIKQEIIDDIDINDDMESFTTNSINGSEADAEFEDEAHPMPPLHPAPKHSDPAEPQHVKIAPKPFAALQDLKTTQKIVTTTSSITNAHRPNGATPATLPFPLLILNGVPAAQNAAAQHITGQKKDIGLMGSQDVTVILRNLLEVQKENLEIEKQRLEIEKQKLQFQKIMGTQLTTLLPMFAAVLEKISKTPTFSCKEEDVSDSEETKPLLKKNGRKRSCADNNLDMLKDSKILRNVLEDGIKKYMMSDEKDEKNDCKGKDDSGIQNSDEDSSASSDKK